MPAPDARPAERPGDADGALGETFVGGDDAAWRRLPGLGDESVGVPPVQADVTGDVRLLPGRPATAEGGRPRAAAHRGDGVRAHDPVAADGDRWSGFHAPDPNHSQNRANAHS